MKRNEKKSPFLIIRDFIRKIISLPIVFYRKFISPLKPRCCRFVPSCSEYAIEAIMTHGVFLGLFLAVKRIVRCNPFGGYGPDPVPEFGTLLPERLFLKHKERLKKKHNINNEKDKD